MRAERGYDYEDTCTVSRETMPNYEEKIKSFYEEHIHSDEVRQQYGVNSLGEIVNRDGCITRIEMIVRNVVGWRWMVG
jgi:1,2-dihydroxy-3-keto-5-methylthiopentene dioxygenase